MKITIYGVAAEIVDELINDLYHVSGVGSSWDAYGDEWCAEKRSEWIALVEQRITMHKGRIVGVSPEPQDKAKLLKQTEEILQEAARAQSEYQYGGRHVGGESSPSVAERVKKATERMKALGDAAVRESEEYHIIEPRLTEAARGYLVETFRFQYAAREEYQALRAALDEIPPQALAAQMDILSVISSITRDQSGMMLQLAAFAQLHGGSREEWDKIEQEGKEAFERDFKKTEI